MTRRPMRAPRNEEEATNLARYFQFKTIFEQQNNNSVYVPILNYPDYEISDTYPHNVRHINSRRSVNLRYDWRYYRLTLNGRYCYLHVVIATTFLRNPNPAVNRVVDHIDIDKLNNRIDNLRYTTQSVNCLNKTHTNNNQRIITFDTLPEGAVPINRYRHYRFNPNEYYYLPNTNEVLKRTEIDYRILHFTTNSAGNQRVLLNTNEGSKIGITIDRFTLFR